MYFFFFPSFLWSVQYSYSQFHVYDVYLKIGNVSLWHVLHTTRLTHITCCHSCVWNRPHVHGPFFFGLLFMNLVFLLNSDLVVFDCLFNKLMHMIYYKCPLVLLYESGMTSPAAEPLFCTVPLQLDGLVVSKSAWLLHKGEQRLL